MSDGNKYIGSSLDEFLTEEGLLESSQSLAIKRVLAWQISRFIQQKNLTKAAKLPALITRPLKIRIYVLSSYWKY